MTLRWLTIAGLLLASGSGCQCWPVFDRYANCVDDINDTHLYFDRVYNPKYDITRMGKPDWCSPWNNWFCPRCRNDVCYDRYDKCNLYPPLHPYELPSDVMPPPTIRTERTPRKLDEELMLLPSERAAEEETLPSPAPVPQSGEK